MLRMSKMGLAVAILAAPFSAQAKWQDTHQKHETAVLVAPAPPPGMVAARPQPGRTSGGTMTVETINPAPQSSSMADRQ